ncbi:restriction endonuclease subunit S [Streptomyces sp. PSRA5]|uniref:restriction endonuclease subunit S n=1 Tax=Streptomyces panacea TaxID=3035064 RepID=UPI00339C5C5D
MTARSALLGEVVDFYAGSSLPEGEDWQGQEGGYLLTRVSDMNRSGNEKYILSTRQWSAAPWQKSATCPGGAVVIPKRGGAIGTNKKRIVLRAAVLDPNLMAMKPHQDVLDLNYLYQWFLAVDLGKLASGSSVPQLNKKDLAPLSISLPSLAQQERIAAVLDQVDTLRAKRREAITLLHDLAQSIFLGMFGDPAANSRNWPQGTVSDLVAGFESGKSVAPGSDEMSQSRVLKVSAVTSGEFRGQESKPLPGHYEVPPNHFARKGDLLFSRANTEELIGAVALVEVEPGRLALPDKLWRFVWPREGNGFPLYVRHLFRQEGFRRQIRERSSGTSGSMKNISQSSVLGIPCGIPPEELQRSFSEYVQRIDKMRSVHRAHLAALDELFTSLQHRAFSGTLWDHGVTTDTA